MSFVAFFRSQLVNVNGPVTRRLSGRIAGARLISSATMTVTAPNGDRSNLIPFSSRLSDGRALALDVWSIFKCVPPYLPSPSPHLSAAPQISLPTASISVKGT